MRTLIIGGTGSFSGRITECAVAHGHEVAIYNRGRRAVPGSGAVTVIEGDRDDLGARADPIAAFAPEAVIDAICFRPEQARDLVAHLGHVQRLILISTVDVYGEEIGAAPVDETRTPTPVSAYGIGKLACERVVFDALGARATAFRPSHILGRGFLTTSLWSRSATLVDRIRTGRAVPAIDGGRNLMTPVYAGDAAEWVVRALTAPAAAGEVFNAVGPEIICQARYYEAIAAALGAPLHLAAVPSHVFRRQFDRPPQFNWHRPYSCRKAVDRLGYAPRFTPEAMIAETVDHMLAHGLVGDASADPFDDRLVALLLRHEAELEALLAEKAG
ncbi:MAG: NAD-dependent epimerase/dehydratase family protein [Anaerolineae bacterium]|nr:NAD-dependent epimerase/dehydratase family protein [Anaerolineae bacterium]